VTSGKKILVFDSETQEKICEVTNAHSKGIYGVALVPEGNDASIVTCSADNTVKTWKLNEESKELTEVATTLQYEGAEEETNRQLCSVVCFIENGALITVAANLQGDLVMSTNGAPSGQISGPKDRPNAITATASDGTVYFTAET